MNEDDRAILNYLNAAEEDPNLERWVLLIKTDHQDFLMVQPKAGSPTAAQADDLLCQREDVKSLADRRYMEGAVTLDNEPSNRVRISTSGKQLIARGFEETPDEPATRSVQNINITGGNVGNLVTTIEGDATVIGSPVHQGAADLGQLLRELVAAIDQSEDLPPDAKDDAKLEANQVALELQRKRLDLAEVERHVVRLRALTGGATAVVTNLDKLWSGIQAFAGA